MKRKAVKKVMTEVERIASSDRISKKAKYPAIVRAIIAARNKPAIRELKNMPKVTNSMMNYE